MNDPSSASWRGADKLLHTKLMPPRPYTAVIPRQDLMARLDVGLHRKLTLVSAPTGFGKTTLVSNWMANRRFASAWVTLDENDNDPTRFWTYLVSALRTFDAAIGKTTLSALAAPQPPSFQTLLLPLINEVAPLQETWVLVLDDYHTILSEEINAGLAFMIQQLPESLHLVLISRNEPALPLGILRARGQMVEMNAADLRFDETETQAFLQDALSSQLSSAIVAKLQERTEGWAAGLRLAALSLQNRNAEEIEKYIQTFSGSQRYVSDYLLHEVFEAQPEAVQNFLLKTCFLTRLTASLCDALTDTSSGAATLEQLERDSLFIVQLERGGDQIWYRYTALFAESLQYLARQRLGEAALKSLFEKASQWYEYHGLYDEAIESALTAGLFERAMLLIEKFIEIHGLSELQTLNRWLGNIPPAELLLYPTICFTLAQIILYTTDRFTPATAARLEPLLKAAETIWLLRENQHRLGQLHSFRGTLAWWQGDLQKAFEFGRQSLDELPESDVFWRGNSLLIASYEALNAGRIFDAQDRGFEARALVGAAQNNYAVLAAAQLLSEIFYWQGELEQAEQLGQQILSEAVGDESMLDDQGVASLILAHISYERNQLEQAQQSAQHALDLAQRRSNEALQVQASLRLAHIYLAKELPTQALELLKSLGASIQNPALLRDIQNAQALFAIRLDDISTLDWWEKIVTAENQTSLPLQNERQAFTLARLRIAEGKPDETLGLLKPWEQDAAEGGRIRSQVEALCLEALASRFNLPKAVKILTKALTIGQARGFRRIFLDEGKRMAALLQAALPMLANRSLSLYTSALLHSFSPEATVHLMKTGSEVQIEPLSQQELRVLRLLVAGLSNMDIASELVVSTNTIKTQVKSIYRKLNVNSRDEARELARELKLLS